MRFPFDLIAAMLCLEGVSEHLSNAGMTDVGGARIIEPLLLGWFAVLLASELSVRYSCRKAVQWLGDGDHKGPHPITLLAWGGMGVQALSVGIYSLWLLESRWPERMAEWPVWFGLSIDSQIGGLYLVRSSTAAIILNMVPFLIASLLAIMPMHRVRQPRSSMLGYLYEEIKIGWLPLGLWLLISILSDGWSMTRTHLPFETATSDSVIAVAGLLIVGVLFPVVVVRFWGARPFPEGGARERLDSLMARSGVKARAIMLWGPPGGGMLNACVMGPLARFRYVLISPGLARVLSMEELEAVLAHELGHARHGHLTLLMLMGMPMTVIGPLCSGWLETQFDLPPMARVTVAFAMLAVYIVCLMGAVLRRFENEADLASAELLGTGEPLINALEKLAVLAGNIRALPSWHHGSIAWRIQRLRVLCDDPAKRVAFQRQQRGIRLVMFTAGIASIIALLAGY